jgi:hypothetical protein
MSRRATTSVMMVADWIAGQLIGSRRSRRSWQRTCQLMGGWGTGRRKECEREPYVHVHAARKEDLAGWVEQEDALNEIEGVHDEQVVLAVAAPDDQEVERREEPLGNVPLEALLQLEELAEGRIAREVGEHLARGLFAVAVPVSPVVDALLPRAAGAGQADLRQQAFDLLQSLLDLAAVKGREVVEGEGEEGLHCECCRGGGMLVEQ